jgi:hypothetical protein
MVVGVTPDGGVVADVGGGVPAVAVGGIGVDGCGNNVLTGVRKMGVCGVNVIKGILVPDPV